MADKKLRTILLVEDNDNDIEFTMLALERAGVANPIEVVRDGVLALEFLRREGQWSNRDADHPAVILLDKKLPRLDGHDVLKSVKNNEDLRNIPIVMLTSSREETDLLKSYDWGVNAYVVNPVQFDDFMKAIGDLGCFWLKLIKSHPDSLGD